MKRPSRFVMASLAWNAYRWRAMDIESTTGHGYTQDNPGHESLNFVFDKGGVDNAFHVYGFIAGARTGMPSFEQPGIIFFHSTNYMNHTRKIVGVYGNAYQIDQWEVDAVDGFDGPMYFNIMADPQCSMLFPVYLDLGGYFDTKKFGRAEIVYADEDEARRIIGDEIELCRMMRKKTDKLHHILKLIA